MIEPLRKRRIRTIIWYISACLIAVCTIFPFLWMIATSFKPMPEIYSRPLNLIPVATTLQNYRDVLNTVPFLLYFKNSMILALAGVLSNVLLGSLAGYGFAKLQIRGKNIVFVLLLSSMMIPSIVTMVPQFVVLRKFPLVGGNNIIGQGGRGFINTLWAIVLTGGVGSYAVFFMRQFFSSLPDDLGEAARIDGSGEFRIFLCVYFPLITPAAITLAILTFQSGWNNFMWPLIVLNDASKHTIQIGLSLFKNNYVTNYGAMMAGTVFSTLPMLILFAFAQRYFIEGIAFSGIKS